MRFEATVFFFILYFVKHYSAQSLGEDFLLPNTTEPVDYVVILTTNVPGAARRFTGAVGIKIKVLENTNEIFLHSRQHIISDVELLDESEDPIEVSAERETVDTIKITSSEMLKEGSFYNLQIEFQGNLLLSSEGFFRSSYVEIGSDIYT